MKTLLLSITGTLLAFSLSAQNPEIKKEQKKAAMNDLHKDVVDRKKERKQVAGNIAHARFKKAVDKHQGVKAENKDIKADAKNLERQGVKHPVTKVKHRIKAEKEAKKARY